MKNPRKIVLTESMIKEHKLSTQPPPPDSLFWQMWSASEQIAQEALGTDFIEGIKNGTLDPVTYGGFNVSDAYYCFSGADDYKTAYTKATDPALKYFLEQKYISYEKYNKDFPNTWRIKDASGVVPTPVCEEYSAFESEIASGTNSIYTIIAMLPCEFLWYWLANQISPASTGNLYAPWISGNDDPHGAYVMGNFLDYYQTAYPGSINHDQAILIYKTAMNFEFRNFQTATQLSK